MRRSRRDLRPRSFAFARRAGPASGAECASAFCSPPTRSAPMSPRAARRARRFSAAERARRAHHAARRRRRLHADRRKLQRQSRLDARRAGPARRDEARRRRPAHRRARRHAGAWRGRRTQLHAGLADDLARNKRRSPLLRGAAYASAFSTPAPRRCAARWAERSADIEASRARRGARRRRRDGQGIERQRDGADRRRAQGAIFATRAQAE